MMMKRLNKIIKKIKNIVYRDQKGFVLLEFVIILPIISLFFGFSLKIIMATHKVYRQQQQFCKEQQTRQKIQFICEKLLEDSVRKFNNCYKGTFGYTSFMPDPIKPVECGLYGRKILNPIEGCPHKNSVVCGAVPWQMLNLKENQVQDHNGRYFLYCMITYPSYPTSNYLKPDEQKDQMGMVAGYWDGGVFPGFSVLDTKYGIEKKSVLWCVMMVDSNMTQDKLNQMLENEVIECPGFEIVAYGYTEWKIKIGSIMEKLTTQNHVNVKFYNS